MPVQYASGLSDPIIREYLMARSQQGAAGHPVTGSMGLGLTSNLQGTAAGGNALVRVKALLDAIGKRKDKAKKKKKDKLQQSREQGRGVNRGRPNPIGDDNGKGLKVGLLW